MREAAILTRHLLRIRRRSLIAWTISVTLYVIVIILVFTAIGDVDFNELMEQYPEEVKGFFGGESLDFSTAIGYLNAEIFSLMLPLALAFLPITIASGAIAAAEDQRHQDVLLGAPVPRGSILVAVLATSAISLAVLLAVLSVASVSFAWVVGVDLGLGELVEACAGVWPLTLFYGAIAILTAAIAPHRGRTVAVSAGILIAMYLTNGLAPLVDGLDTINAVSVFNYYTDWTRDGLQAAEALAMTAVACALTAVAVPIYRRRDIQG